jgi:hypothetical protein
MFVMDGCREKGSCVFKVCGCAYQFRFLVWAFCALPLPTVFAAPLAGLTEELAFLAVMSAAVERCQWHLHALHPAVRSRLQFPSCSCACVNVVGSYLFVADDALLSWRFLVYEQVLLLLAHLPLLAR